MASSAWTRDPVLALEELTETVSADQVLPPHAPVMGKPILRAYFGLVPEEELGQYGSPQRRAHETELARALLQHYSPHIYAAGPTKLTQEASPMTQWDLLFHSSDTATEARQSSKDEGGVQLSLADIPEPVWIPVRDGPARLPSSLVRVVVSNLPADFMIPGVIPCLLQSAGYTLGGENGVVVRAEHGGEHRAAIAAFAPDIMRLGVVVGIVRPPPHDRTLHALPRAIAHADGHISITVAHQPIQPPAALQQELVPPPPGFVRQSDTTHDDASALVYTRGLTRALDPVIDLAGQAPGDRRGLGHALTGLLPDNQADSSGGTRAIAMREDSQLLPRPVSPPPSPPPPPPPLPPPASSLLPDAPLVGTVLDWLADNLDVTATHEYRCQIVLQFVADFPAVFTRYEADIAQPPAPEVRSALRDMRLPLVPDSPPPELSLSPPRDADSPRVMEHDALIRSLMLPQPPSAAIAQRPCMAAAPIRTMPTPFMSQSANRRETRPDRQPRRQPASQQPQRPDAKQPARTTSDRTRRQAAPRSRHQGAQRPPTGPRQAEPQRQRRQSRPAQQTQRSQRLQSAPTGGGNQPQQLQSGQRRNQQDVQPDTQQKTTTPLSGPAAAARMRHASAAPRLTIVPWWRLGNQSLKSVTTASHSASAPGTSRCRK